MSLGFKRLIRAVHKLASKRWYELDARCVHCSDVQWRTATVSYSSSTCTNWPFGSAEKLTAVYPVTKFLVFWNWKVASFLGFLSGIGAISVLDLAPRHWTIGSWRFETACWCHQVLHGHLPLQEDTTTLPKRLIPIPSDTASHLRRTKPQLEGALPS